MENNNEKPPFLFRFANSSWADWMITHKKISAIFSAFLVMLIVAGVWWMQASKTREIKDYETADVLAEELQKHPALFELDDSVDVQLKSHLAALNQLRFLVDTYPSLQTRFDSLLGQEYLLISQKNAVDPYAKRAILRMHKLGLHDFADFSNISRLSGLQQYKEALKKAHELKLRLQARKKAALEPSHDFALTAYLLLHIATLNQKIGNPEATLQSIFELKEFLGITNRTVPLSSQEKGLASEILAHLQENQGSLLDYIIEKPKP